MDHSEAVRLMATERYLLNEFTPAQKEEFEEHFFGCQECALDVRMGAALVEHAPAVLKAAEPVAAPHVTKPQKAGWLGWLRPAAVIPVMAVLLAVIGIQAFVVRPRLEDTIATLKQPQVLPSAYLNAGVTRGANLPVVTARPGIPFVLFIDVPGEARSASYVAELYSPTGDKEWSLVIPPETIQTAHGTLPIRVSLTHEQAGAYALVLRESDGSGSAGQQVQRYPFELQFH